jgi:SCY1-like protein 2
LERSLDATISRSQAEAQLASGDLIFRDKLLNCRFQAMFSSAFKSFTSNITSNYEISKQPVATAGAWQVFDAKKRGTNTQASVFIFDRKSLDVSASFGSRQSATSVRKAQDEVVERLKKEASSLARLRHPSILQLIEPVEDTRSGGLIFVSEAVVASLAGALSEKDDQDRNKNGGRASSRYGGDEIRIKRQQDLELDELEIQKGFLQVSKGLEFLHDSAKLVHGNLTPDAILINAKSDWKISGLAFSGPPDGAEGHQNTPQISLSEVLYNDTRIPRFVQLDLDYTSPDFVLDSNINASADVFSLGLVILATYNSPHRSPLETNGNQATYKNYFKSPQTAPSSQNNFLCNQALPRELLQTLPRMLARRPAQRITASEFQQSAYFDNVLVNTIRFLDALPAKTPAEKSQFMRGLGRVMPQFPPSVLGKKVLSVLLDELKDRELLPLILQNIFSIVKVIPSAKQTFPEKILPRLREVFLTKSKSEERDTSKEAGLVVVLENIQLISTNCSAKEFKEDVLPILHLGMESSTHTLVDASLQAIPTILPLLDFTTVKHDLFPVVANVFSKTSSLNIKVKGLEALSVLCGASNQQRESRADDFSGVVQKEDQNKTVSSLDKFTMQEKIIPLLKGIKTKEPAVMMAALSVFQQIGKVADTYFVAVEIMPILWAFSLGPLLNLTQFQAYMSLIKSMSSKIEREQIRKLQELSSSTKTTEVRAAPVGYANGTSTKASSTGVEDDFERLVLSNRNDRPDPFAGALSTAEKLTPNPPSFSWSSSNNAQQGTGFGSMTTLQPQPASRSITPDVTAAGFPSLQPRAMASTFTPLQPQSSTMQTQTPQYSILPPRSSSNVWHANSTSTAPPTFLLPPAVGRQTSFPTHQNSTSGFGTSTPASAPPPIQQRAPTGLDKYQSLL